MTEVHEVHKHLYHYTNLEGLKGILDTQTLWATHFKGLNDSSEIELMRPLLEEKLFELINAIVSKDAKKCSKYKRKIEKLGGITKASRGEAKNFTDFMYKRMFLRAPGLVPMAEPYILSFCGHTNHDDYVKKNGLLSQWRAYGGDGGYALILDTLRLTKCLKVEPNTYSYSQFLFGDVLYDDQSDKFETVFADLHRGLEAWTCALEVSKKLPDENLAQPFFNVATRFKHRGFKEESEVRVSVSPVTEALEKTVCETSLLKLKPIQHREKDGSQVRYIVLNDVPKKKSLPIIRIIIGPQRDQKQRAKDVKKLIGKRKIEIVCSETPYLPPQAHISS